jgi:hypothetical protein
MSRHFPDNTSTVGAFGAAAATVALVALALLPRPFAPMDHLSILSGSAHLTGEQLIAYKSYIESNFTVDSFYLMAHSIMWLGLANLLSARSPRLGSLVLIFGLLGAALDLLENQLRWAAMTILFSGNLPTASYVAIWQTVFGLSFWALFLASIFTGIGVARSSRCGNVVAAWSLIGIFVASSIFKAGFLPSFLWLILWHISCAFLLWSNRASIENQPRA